MNGLRVTPLSSATRLRVIACGAGAAFLVVLPLVLQDRQLTVFFLIGTAAIVAVGTSLLMGYAGQVSLGQGGFFAIGAYTTSLLSIHGVPTLASALAAPLVAGAVGAAIAVPISRLRGHYLAFATLAFHLILLALIGQLEFLGGDIGLAGVPQLSLGRLELTTGRAYAWLVAAALALVLVISRNIVGSRVGRGLRAVATSETAAASTAVPVARYKLSVFSLAAGFAGLSGAIYAHFMGYISPASFPVVMSVEFVVIAVVGGLGTIAGAVIGAAVITLLVQWLNTIGTQPGMPTYAPSVLSYAVYALLITGVILLMPRGLVPTISGSVGRFTKRRTRQPAARRDSVVVSR